MYNYKIKTSFVSSEMSQACANKNGFNIMIGSTFLYSSKTGYNDTIHDFSVWLTTGSNPAVNRF